MKLELRANKRGLAAIGRALGLRCSERERSADLAKRVLEAARRLRHDFDLAMRTTAWCGCPKRKP